MKWYHVKLRFTAPVRFGSDVARINLENAKLLLHADTLFSALCNVWMKYRVPLPASIDDFGAVFTGDAPFRLSSGFPYVAGRTPGRTDFFLPRPALSTPHLAGDVSTLQRRRWSKVLKRARYVRHDHFRRWLGTSSFLHPNWEPELEGWTRAVVEETRPQHAQDRLTAASALFHVGRYVFDPEADAGLYVLVAVADDAWADALDAGFRLLSRDGVGGERSSGLGRFRSDGDYARLLPLPSRLDYLTQTPTGDAPYVALGPYLPTASERAAIQARIGDHDDVAYSLLPRRGWTFSTTTRMQVKRKSVHTFAEGSTFGGQAGPLGGQCVDLHPDDAFPHAVWRLCAPLSVPLLA